MIKMKYSEFMRFDFAQSFQKLVTFPVSGETAYLIKKIGDECNKARIQIQAEYKDLMLQYCKLDDKGEIFRPDEKDPNSFDIPEDKIEEFKKKEAEFGDNIVTINRNVLDPKRLEGLKLTAGEAAALYAIIDFKDPEEVKEAAAKETNVTPLKQQKKAPAASAEATS